MKEKWFIYLSIIIYIGYAQDNEEGGTYFLILIIEFSLQWLNSIGVHFTREIKFCQYRYLLYTCFIFFIIDINE